MCWKLLKCAAWGGDISGCVSYTSIKEDPYVEMHRAFIDEIQLRWNNRLEASDIGYEDICVNRLITLTWYMWQSKDFCRNEYEISFFHVVTLSFCLVFYQWPSSAFSALCCLYVGLYFCFKIKGLMSFVCL